MRSGNRYAMLAVLIGMGFIAAFNENTVNVALINIQAEFDVSSVASQWLVTGYMIVSAIVSAICAFLLHRYSLRSIVFIAGAVFVASSLSAMIAPNFALLLASRLIQAIGTGLYVPIMMTTILKVAPRERMGTLLSVGNMCLTLGPALGPVVTGAMISFFGWRTVFLPGAIIMLVLLVLAIFLVYNVHETAPDSIDVPSVILASIGLTFFMYGLTLVSSDLVVSIVLLVIGGTILVIFGRRQRRIPVPLLNMSPLSDIKFVISCLVLAVAMMTSFSTTVLLPQYLQVAVGVSALVTGALILLPVMCNVAFSMVGGRIFDKMGEIPLLPLGYFLMMASVFGMCAFSYVLSLAPVIVCTCTTFVALGLVYTATQAAGLKRLTEREHAHGVSIMNVLVMIAGAFGTSLYGGIAQAGTNQALMSGLQDFVAQGIGFSNAMGVGTGFVVVAFLLTFAFMKRPAPSRTSNNSKSE